MFVHVVEKQLNVVSTYAKICPKVDHQYPKSIYLYFIHP